MKIFKTVTVCLLVMAASTWGYMTYGAEARNTVEKGTNQTNTFKVIGYYSGDLFNEPVEKLQTDKLTHVMYAFLIPKDDGSLVPLEKPEQLKQVVEQARAENCKVFIALGGWSYKQIPLVTTFEKIGKSKELRQKLVKNVTNFALENDLDGVELDWEHPNANSIGDYENLVVELKAALKPHGKELSAALNGAWSTTAGPEISKLYTKKSLDAFDFMSVMAYDMNNQEHSPLWFASTSINYWLNKNIPPEKIVLGMPLYARPSWIQYRDLVKLNPENAYKDFADTTPLKSYYNGLNTLREKTKIAMLKAGGVMLFDVNEDSEGEYSVVSMIAETVGHMKDLTKSEKKEHISLIVDNRQVYFNKEDGFGVPFIDAQNRILLPVRKALEAIGAEVSYDIKTQTVEAKQGDVEIVLRMGEQTIQINGKETPMDTVATLIEERTYIPLRAVYESFGYEILWSNVSNTAYVY